MPIPIDEAVDFATQVNNIGVSSADTFDDWRKKTNGIIDKVGSMDLVVATKADTATLANYVDIASGQTITGIKFFSGGTQAAPKLKVHSTHGFYFDATEAAIASSTSLQSPKLINSGSTIKLNGVTYALPNTGSGLLSWNGSALSWVSEASVASNSFTVTTTNMVMPVGTIIPWASSSVTPPAAWFFCDGSTRTVLAELAAVLGTTYGPILNSSNVVLFARGATPPVYNPTFKYTLPNKTSGELTDLPPSPASVIRYIIKAQDDPIVVFGIELGPSLSATSFAGAPITRIGINGGNLQVKFNTNVLASAASGLDIKDGGVLPVKLSTGAPSWDTGGKVTLLAEPTIGSHATTKTYVDAKVATIRVGEALRFPEKSSGAKSTSTQTCEAFAYIDSRGDVNVNGASTYSRFGDVNAACNVTIPLPLGRIASKLYIGHEFMIVIDTLGKCWAMGRNDFNQLGMTAWDGLTSQPRWIRAFESIQVCSKIIMSGDRYQVTIYALDSAGNLWSAGVNDFGQLMNGRIGTSTVQETLSDSTDPGQAHIVRTQVVDACMAGGWSVSGVSTGVSICVLSGPLGARKVYCGGWGGYGVMGDGTEVTANPTWKTVKTGPGVDLLDITEIWVAGGHNATYYSIVSYYAKTSTGVMYAWGCNIDGRFGQVTSNSNPYAIQIWNPTTRSGQTITKFLTNCTGVNWTSTLLLTSAGKVYCSGYNPVGMFGQGNADHLYTFTEVPWSSTPGTSGLTPIDVFMSNNYYDGGIAMIVAIDGSGVKSLWTCGHNYQGGGALGRATYQTYTFTRCNVSQSIIDSIADVWVFFDPVYCFTSFLLLNNGTVVYSGYNYRGFDQGFAEGANRYSFTRARAI